jgi:hypothetical protein
MFSEDGLMEKDTNEKVLRPIQFKTLIALIAHASNLIPIVDTKNKKIVECYIPENSYKRTEDDVRVVANNLKYNKTIENPTYDFTVETNIRANCLPTGSGKTRITLLYLLWRKMYMMNLNEPSIILDEQIKLVPKEKINIPFLIIPQNQNSYISELAYIKGLKVIGSCFQENFTTITEKSFNEAIELISCQVLFPYTFYLFINCCKNIILFS